MSRPILRFTQAPLTRAIHSTPRIYGLKKAASLTAKAKQGFSKKKKEDHSGGGGASASISLRYSGSAHPPDLSDLPQLRPDMFRKDNVGKPTLFSKLSESKFKTFGLPRKLQEEFSSAGGAATVVREATLDLAKKVETAKSTSSKSARYVLTGEKGVGKSMLLMQSVAYALETGWIVLYSPQASKWTNSTSHYMYDPATKVYSQWETAQALLSVLLEANRDKLSSMKVTSTIDLARGISMREGQSLTALIELGIKDDRTSVKAFSEVMAALEQQTEYPVMWAIDEAQTLFDASKYRAADYSPIESYHLSTPRLALDFIAGRRSFARGTILTSLSYGSPTTLPSPSLRTALSLRSTRPLTPYTPLDQYHVAHASHLTPVPIPASMTPQEAVGLFEIYAKKGWAKGLGDEAFVHNFVASGGNPEEMGRGLNQTFLALTI